MRSRRGGGMTGASLFGQSMSTWIGRSVQALTAAVAFVLLTPACRTWDQSASAAPGVQAKPRLIFRAVGTLDAKAPRQMFRPELTATPFEVLTGPAEFPASFFAQFEDGFCSATLVGATAVLTAAHCLSGDTEFVHFVHGGATITADCSRASQFNSSTNRNDWAMCSLSQPIPAHGGLLYESVNTALDLVKKGDTLLVTGFGPGIFQPRQVTVAIPPSAADERVFLDGRTLTGGDSGGASFRYFGFGYTNRVEVAVNSTIVTATEDSLSHLGSDTGLDFLKTWTQAHPNDSICGATTNAKDCRNPAPAGAIMVK
jgi:hypothetical protein